MPDEVTLPTDRWTPEERAKIRKDYLKDLLIDPYPEGSKERHRIAHLFASGALQYKVLVHSTEEFKRVAVQYLFMQNRPFVNYGAYGVSELIEKHFRDKDIIQTTNMFPVLILYMTGSERGHAYNIDIPVEILAIREVKNLRTLLVLINPSTDLKATFNPFEVLIEPVGDEVATVSSINNI